MTAQRAAIVTGASSGIGLAITRALVQEGHAVTLTARDADRLEHETQKLRAGGADVQGVPVSLGRDPGAVKRIVDAHRERFGRCDVLVNNAAVATQAPIDEMDGAKIDLQLDVNLRSVVEAYREALPMLRAAAADHRSALVVNTASIAARVPETQLSIYAASKGAMISFTHAMNKELGHEGIKSCAILPGIVATPLTEYLQGTVPAAEMIQPEDVGEVVRMLLRFSPTCVVAEIELQRPGALSW